MSFRDRTYVKPPRPGDGERTPVYNYWVRGVFFLEGGSISLSLPDGEEAFSLLHREEGPAAIGGTVEWRRHGLLFRAGGPALVWNNDNAFEWYEGDSGLRHRMGAPARIYRGGARQWWENGQLHRVDGPAIIRHDGRESYFIYGKEYHTFDAYLDGLLEAGVKVYRRDFLQKSVQDATYERALIMHGLFLGDKVRLGDGELDQDVPSALIADVSAEVKELIGEHLAWRRDKKPAPKKRTTK